MPSGANRKAPKKSAKRTYNVGLVRRAFSYSIQEIAEVFDLHTNAVRRWIKSGLPTIDDRRPQLVHGSELIDFLAKRQQRRKMSCAPGEMLCCRCREPRRPEGGRVIVDRLNARQLILRGNCDDCGTPMNRCGAVSRLPEIEREFTIATGPRHLNRTTGPVVKCDLPKGT